MSMHCDRNNRQSDWDKRQCQQSRILEEKSETGSIKAQTGGKLVDRIG